MKFIKGFRPLPLPDFNPVFVEKMAFNATNPFLEVFAIANECSLKGGWLVT